MPKERSFRLSIKTLVENVEDVPDVQKRGIVGVLRVCFDSKLSEKFSI